jgi:hypothetical protein
MTDPSEKTSRPVVINLNMGTPNYTPPEIKPDTENTNRPLMDCACACGSKAGSGGGQGGGGEVLK